MASALVKRAGLTPEVLGELASGVDVHHALPTVLFLVDGTDDAAPRWGVAYVVRSRANGFMLAVAADPDLGAVLELMVPDGQEIMSHTGAVTMVSMRGRQLGPGELQLVDLVWDCSHHFIKQASLKGALLRSSVLVGPTIDGERCRPAASSALQLSEEWIGQVMEGEPAQEYLTAVEEELVPEDEEEEPTPSLLPDAAAASEVEELKRKVKLLESQLLQKTQPGKPPPPPPGKPELFGKTPGLFQPGRTGGVPPQDLQRLAALAGSPPPRTGQHEQRRQLDPLGDVPHQDALLAEVEKEVMEPALGDLHLGQPQTDSGVLSQILVAQLQQNALLLQKVLGKQPADPIMGALSGSDSGSAGSSQGVKGCVAREAFCKTAQDLDVIATSVRRNALAELGMDISREDESVMRRYIERRIPLADHRLLCHVATLAAEGWAVAFKSQNQQMLGFLGLLLMFVEQVALDHGKVQLGWLLTGLAEPNHQIHFSHSKTPGLKPFSRLANPVWVSANLAYLRDLDFLESRMDQIGRKKSSGSPPSPEEGSDRPKPKPKIKPRKGKGKGSEQAESTGDASK